jgi:precorrin-8X/cobalt-precorrin-8 methylmutase
MVFEIVSPREIEEKSMQTIVSELNGRTWPEPQFSVVKRCIHTSADFDYADNLVFGEGSAEKGVEILRNGCVVVTDTKMAAAGINKNAMSRHGGEVKCFISDPDVIEEAKARGCTRATVCMEKAAKEQRPVIMDIGNAPTALIEIDSLIRSGKLRPAMVIGVPVGFVNVVESKELIIDTCEEFGIPYIVARGRKGGSNIAATIINALLYTMGR